jgi:DNA modification methylase
MPFDDFIQFEYADTVDLHVGDCRTILQELPTGIFQSCITSPPYFGLRSYLPDLVKLNPALPPQLREKVIEELEALGVRPITKERNK